MGLVMHTLDLVGTAVSATTGALAAGGKRMDAFGVVVLGCVTALGGGTLQDVVPGSRPVFWISHTEYLAVAAMAAAGTFVLAQRWRLPVMVLIYADAVGLAARHWDLALPVLRLEAGTGPQSCGDQDADGDSR